MSAPIALARNGISPLAIAGHLFPWLFATAVFFTAGGYLSLWTNAFIAVLLVLSLDLVLGFAGIVTVGMAAFYGFGAYSAGLFDIHVSTDPLLGLLAASLAAALLGAVSGMLILHTRGVALLMLTLSLTMLLWNWAEKANDLTGGDNGLDGIHTGKLLGRFDFDFYGNTAYVYVVCVLLAWFLVARVVIASPFGRSLDGIRQSPARMRAIGTPVWWRLVAVYTLGAAMAGSAGALYAQTTQLVALSSLDVLLSATALIMLVLGGVRRLYGAFLGAVVYVVAQDALAKDYPSYWMVGIGAALILVVLFLEGGLMELLDMALRVVRRRGEARQ